MEAIKRINLYSHLLKLSILLVILIASFFTAISIGAVHISFPEIWDVLINNDKTSTVYQIIFEIRLPRVLLAISVGGGLSVAGAVFQALLMNPLAEPYILGISSGGTFGAILSFLLGLSFLGTQVLAFAGALTVVAIVFLLGKRFGEIEPNVMLLTGVMIGAFFSALILLMMTMLDESLKTAIYWLIGNISLANMSSVTYVLPITIIISIILSFNGHKYNVLSLGTDTAKQLGINAKMLKNSSYVLSSIMVGSIVSVSGIIGFVGLLVPHICRFVFGVDNRIIIPASFLLGGAYLALADTIARTAIEPAEIPVGAITAIIGAPIFIYLLRRRFKLIS